MVLDRVDERLRMLDAHAHRKGLGLDAHAARVQQFVHVVRRMPRSEHHGGPLDPLVAAADATNPPVAQQEVRHAAVEAKHPARIGDRPPDIADDIGQLVGADMGMGFAEDFGRGAVKDERLQRLVVIAALLAAREELAVGKGSRAALAESVVRVGIDGAVAVDPCDVALAGRDVAPPFENHGPQSQFDEPQGREQPRGARSDDDDLRPPLDRRIVEMHGAGLRLPIDIDFERQVHLHLPLPGVDRPLHDAHQRHIRLPDAHAPRCERRAVLRIGGLFRREDEGYLSGHKSAKLPTNVNKKSRIIPRPDCVL